MQRQWRTLSKLQYSLCSVTKEIFLCTCLSQPQLNVILDYFFPVGCLFAQQPCQSTLPQLLLCNTETLHHLRTFSKQLTSLTSYSEPEFFSLWSPKIRFRKSSTIRGRPSLNAIFGSHPSSSFAFEMSGFRLWGSSDVFSLNSILAAGSITSLTTWAMYNNYESTTWCSAVLKAYETVA